MNLVLILSLGALLLGLMQWLWPDPLKKRRKDSGRATKADPKGKTKGKTKSTKHEDSKESQGLLEHLEERWKINLVKPLETARELLRLAIPVAGFIGTVALLIALGMNQWLSVILGFSVFLFLNTVLDI